MTCHGSGESIEEALADDDCNLVNLLKRARSVNLKFNKNKLRLKLDQVTYMVQFFTSEGLKPDPIEIEAIASMPRPDDKRGVVQRLLECVNYLSRFMPQLTKVSQPLRELTEKNAMFTWVAHRRKLSKQSKA